MKKTSCVGLIIGFAMTLILTGCGGGGSSSNADSFISGNGAVTFMKIGHRIQAPQIKGLTLDSSTYILPKGKVAVINVWASWCSPCRAEAPTLSALSHTFPEVNFVGILTRDNPASAKAFVKRFSITYPTLTDDALLLGFRKSLIANAIPSTLVIDKKGLVAGRISGEITVASLTDLINKVEGE
ncbi:MAG: redoxin domain-containing protein [Actinobacteria bacterium]|uniref:Unannotated protein n=1 Tax=freshwater metagenome TaxID=449393 RepID=A0A6J6Y7G2_9ZZZZ|nr:redoxin domain-containing protein [Actinomycetota bacterium]